MAPRIGLFGGTFDPPHRGHIAAAETVHRILELDRTILMVANDPWQKSGTRALTPATVRLEMVRAAVEGRDGLEPGDLEVRRGGVSYTADTVEELRALEPDAEVFVIVGVDAAARFATWRRHDDIVRVARLVAVTRPGHRPPLGPEWLTVEMAPVDVSSTDIRSRVGDGRAISDDVSPAVARIISDRRLYSGTGS